MFVLYPQKKRKKKKEPNMLTYTNTGAGTQIKSQQ